jgi:hypothetical protein
MCRFVALDGSPSATLPLSLSKTISDDRVKAIWRAQNLTPSGPQNGPLLNGSSHMALLNMQYPPRKGNFHRNSEFHKRTDMLMLGVPATSRSEQNGRLLRKIYTSYSHELLFRHRTSLHAVIPHESRSLDPAMAGCLKPRNRQYCKKPKLCQNRLYTVRSTFTRGSTPHAFPSRSREEYQDLR